MKSVKLSVSPRIRALKYKRIAVTKKAAFRKRYLRLSHLYLTDVPVRRFYLACTMYTLAVPATPLPRVN